MRHVAVGSDLPISLIADFVVDAVGGKFGTGSA
jgi:hypothetical protein